MQSIRTLLVDDVGPALSMKARLDAVRDPSLAVEHLRTLRSAVSRVRLGSIDVVLLDLQLPDSSGVGSVVRLHAAAPDVPIVVLTEANGEDLAIRSLRACAEDYLVKSRVNRAVLQRTIRSALERNRIKANVARNLRALKASEARFRNLVASSTDGVVVVSRTGTVLFANPSAARVLGRPIDEFRVEMLGFAFALRTRHEWSVGSERVVEVNIVDGEWDGAPVRFVSLFDITRHKRCQSVLEEASTRLQSTNVRLERLASIDPLTELLNRRGLETVLSIETRRRLRSGAPLAAILLDCDDFKGINDSLGHSSGDFVLKEIAGRLQESLRPSDHIGRIGGDEFLVLLPETRFAEAFQVAERLRLSVNAQQLRISSGLVHVTASLGLALLSDEISSIDEVLVLTEAALQHSKRNGKNRLSSQDVGAADGAADSEALALGLVEGAFRVLRQPILRLSDESVIGWDLTPLGPAGTFESARDFFRLALERKILTQVDLHCLRTCIAHARELPGSSRCHVHVFPSTLIETSCACLSKLFSPPLADHRFCIEISEQHMIGDPALLRDHVRVLKDAGILVALDDVGFGRTSLETLILLEPDLVKIDQAFVHRSARDSGQTRWLRRMIDVVASLGSELVADGIESAEDLALLLELGVACGQGPLWGEPAQSSPPAASNLHLLAAAPSRCKLSSSVDSRPGAPDPTVRPKTGVPGSWRPFGPRPVTTLTRTP
jgi:diguanylate cyclase (GGDEF)-like protein